MITQKQLQELVFYADGKLFWCQHRYEKRNGTELGYISANGYVRTEIQGKKYYVHRLIFLYHHGYFPANVDHINGNRLDNRLENLREATSAQNNHNRSQDRRNKSGFKGVCWSKAVKKWHVQVGISNFQQSFGYFDDIELADLVAQEARDKYHKGFAKHD